MKKEINFNFGFFGLLTIIFIFLKVLGLLKIGWFIVFLPVLLPIGFFACLFLFVLFFTILGGM